MNESEEKRRAWLAHKADLARARRAKKKKAKTAAAVPAPRAAFEDVVARPVRMPPVATPVAAAMTARSGRGGARIGAGRKPKHADERMRSVTFRATKAQHAEFVRLGGADWLRASLNRSVAREAKKA